VLRHPSGPSLSFVPFRPSHLLMVRGWVPSRVCTMRLSAGRDGPRRYVKSRVVERGDGLSRLQVGSLLFGLRLLRSRLGVGWPWIVLIGLRRRPLGVTPASAARYRIFVQSVDHVSVKLNYAETVAHTTRSIVPSSAVSWPILGVMDLRIVDHCDFRALFPLTAAIGPVLRNCVI
jgi:hypothetical protein